MGKKVTLGFILLPLICIGISLVWMIFIAGPVLFAYRDPSSGSLGPSFILLNPFREKGAERISEKFFLQIRDGNCDASVSQLDLPQSVQHEICEKETTYPLEDWYLADLDHNGQIVTLQYRIKRRGFSGYGGIVYLELEKHSDDWKPVTANFIY